MMRLNIAIDYLANCPELVDELARLSWKEWQEIYQQREQTLEDCLKNYRHRMNTDRLPLTFVAVRASKLDLKLARRPTLSSRALAILPSMSPVPPAPFPSELVGMVSLKFHDMDTRPDLDPWLGGLLVLPEWRNRGVGTMLMRRAPKRLVD